jgi:hypothetical protein
MPAPRCRRARRLVGGCWYGPVHHPSNGSGAAHSLGCAAPPWMHTRLGCHSSLLLLPFYCSYATACRSPAAAPVLLLPRCCCRASAVVLVRPCCCSTPAAVALLGRCGASAAASLRCGRQRASTVRQTWGACMHASAARAGRTSPTAATRQLGVTTYTAPAQWLHGWVCMRSRKVFLLLHLACWQRPPASRRTVCVYVLGGGRAWGACLGLLKGCVLQQDLGHPLLEYPHQRHKAGICTRVPAVKAQAGGLGRYHGVRNMCGKRQEGRMRVSGTGECVPHSVLPMHSAIRNGARNVRVEEGGGGIESHLADLL